MNIDSLKCFILVAENLSFARTAEALYISQPAVTKQINALEKELGVTLFIRSTRHVELTPPAFILLSWKRTVCPAWFLRITPLPGKAPCLWKTLARNPSLRAIL